MLQFRARRRTVGCMCLTALRRPSRCWRRWLFLHEVVSDYQVEVERVLLIGDDDVVRLQEVDDVSQEDGCGLLRSHVIALSVTEPKDVLETDGDSGLA
jgi:hypothetical protein